LLSHFFRKKVKIFILFAILAINLPVLLKDAILQQTFHSYIEGFNLINIANMFSEIISRDNLYYKYHVAESIAKREPNLNILKLAEITKNITAYRPICIPEKLQDSRTVYFTETRPVFRLAEDKFEICHDDLTKGKELVKASKLIRFFRWTLISLITFYWIYKLSKHFLINFLFFICGFIGIETICLYFASFWAIPLLGLFVYTYYHFKKVNNFDSFSGQTSTGPSPLYCLAGFILSIPFFYQGLSFIFTFNSSADDLAIWLPRGELISWLDSIYISKLFLKEFPNIQPAYIGYPPGWPVFLSITHSIFPTLNLGLAGLVMGLTVMTSSYWLCYKKCSFITPFFAILYFGISGFLTSAYAHAYVSMIIFIVAIFLLNIEEFNEDKRMFWSFILGFSVVLSRMETILFLIPLFPLIFSRYGRRRSLYKYYAIFFASLIFSFVVWRFIVWYYDFAESGMYAKIGISEMIHSTFEENFEKIRKIYTYYSGHVLTLKGEYWVFAGNLMLVAWFSNKRNFKKVLYNFVLITVSMMLGLSIVIFLYWATPKLNGLEWWLDTGFFRMYTHNYPLFFLYSELLVPQKV